MSREERKMAHIIASIERMEQKKLINSDSTLSTTSVESDSMLTSSEENKENIDQLQTKARKTKSTKTLKSTSKLKSKSKRKDKQSSSNDKEYITPKKRWIMRWNALVAADTQEKETEQEQEQEQVEQPEKTDIAEQEPKSLEKNDQGTSKEITPVTEQRTAVAENSIKSQDQVVEKESSNPSTGKDVTEPVIVHDEQNTMQVKKAQVNEANSSSEPGQQDKPLTISTDNEEVVVDIPKAEPSATTSSSIPLADEPALEKENTVDEEKVIRDPTSALQETQVLAGTLPLHLSPPEEQSTAATSSLSISPSMKDMNLPSITVVEVAGSSNEKEDGEEEEVEIQVPVVAEKVEVIKQESKRKLPDDDLSPEDLKWIEDRRKKRKHNWDVGDPRLGYSPTEQRNPSSRPTWRHSSSMSDTKSSFYPRNSGPRRFHHSQSLPFERSRSVGRFARSNYNSNR